MECFKIENLSFAYPNREHKALNSLNITIGRGEFVTVCGRSGCGKTTLLRLMKPSVSPFGCRSGRISFEGRELASYDTREEAQRIGFVMQSPENQIVTDKVWHELAFGLESLGMSTPEIRTRVSEMASFFGIQTWFRKNVCELSGGQKQLLNLASVMVMQPSVLILDEPTSQLDPIAAQEFLNILAKINRELGTTVILSEHRLEDAIPISDRVIIMDDGAVTADCEPRALGEILKNGANPMAEALPTPIRIWCAVNKGAECPLTVREGRRWLGELNEKNEVNPRLIPRAKASEEPEETVIELRDVWFRYGKDMPDVIRGLNMAVGKGELFALVGGNGTGKTTALSLISGLVSPHRGKIFIKGREISKIGNLYNGLLGVLPQNPQALFVKKTVYLDLLEMLSEKKLSKEQKDEKIRDISELCRIEGLLKSHPYDLSGGEQQRTAIAKVLLNDPEILILDEPTKGMDAAFKREFADILEDLKRSGATVVMVSHDIEFCAEYADRCAMFFDGSLAAQGTPREFFAGKSFYTTAANRMAREVLPDAVLAEDIIAACGGVNVKRERKRPPVQRRQEEKTEEVPEQKKRRSPVRMIVGCLFAVLFVLTSVSFMTDRDILNLSQIRWLTPSVLQVITVVQAAAALFCFFPRQETGGRLAVQTVGRQKLGKRTVFAAFLALLVIPLTIYFGIRFFDNRKYYFVSLLIILETMIPFFMVFESRKPRARELVVICVLCALAVAGRTAFMTVPQFKPVVALVIISGVCFGGETGFLVGAVTGFVSNFFFGQGPWTPWQMFAFGIIGFIAGILFKKGFLKRSKGALCVFGFLAAVLIYGVIMNTSTVFQLQSQPTAEMLGAAIMSGLPFDLVHGASTAFFLWFISAPMIEKLERIKIKYGLIER